MNSPPQRPARPTATAADYSGLLDTLDRAVLVVDEHGCVLFANARARAWFGDGDGMLGRPAPIDTSGDGPELVDIRPVGSTSTLTMQRTVVPLTWAGASATMIMLRDISPLRNAEEHLRRLTRLHTALAQITATLARAAEADDPLDEICRTVVAVAGFRAVWIGRANDERTRLVRVAGAGASVVEADGVALDAGPRSGPIAQAWHLGTPSVSNRIAADPQLAGWHVDAQRLEVGSLAACPLHTHGHVQGVIAFFAREPECFDRELVSIVVQIATEVSRAFERLDALEQHRQVEELRRSAEQQLYRFQGLIETAGDAFYIVDPADDFRLIYINDAGVRHLGWPRDTLLQMRPWQWDPNFTADTTRALWAMIRDRGSTLYETTTQDRTGRRVRVEVVASVLRTGDGEFMAGYFRDVTARAQAEAELRDSEERFRAVFEEASDALILVEPADNRFVDCNANAVLLFEAETKERLLAMHGPELVAGTMSAEQIEANRAQIARIGTWSGLLEYRTLKGRRFWGAAAVRRIEVSGRTLHILRITDTTENRRLNELLTDTERLARIGGWEYYCDTGRTVWTNGSYLIHGIEPGTTITREKLAELYEPGFNQVFEAAAFDLKQPGQPWTLETRLRVRERETWIRILGNTELVEGKPHRLHGTIEDVTESRLAAASLRERDERLQEQALLLDEATDAIIACDATGLIQVWNRGAERLLGWTREEAVGRHAGALHFMDQGVFAAALATAREHGMWNGELEYRTRAGTRVLVESRWTLRLDAAGTPRTVLTINTDITEKKRRETSQLRAQRLESIGTLAGGIAHDLNNILAPVVLSSDILRLRTHDETDLELINAIGASARRGAEVVRQVLSFARGVEGTHIPINIRHLLPEIRHIVSETFPRTIACRVEAQIDLWSVMGEPTQLHQVLLNLCLNSRDAMPEGGTLTLKASNMHVDEAMAAPIPGARPGPHVRIQVTDTGSGIPPEVRDRIFEPFFTTKGPGRGSGLGLSTAMAIVRSHRGFITVDSESGRGTAIAVHFPAERPVGAVIPAAPPVPSEVPGRGQTILVIDDEASVRSITRQSLETAGYRVLTAEDGARGISLFVQHRDEIALVLTDMMMPVMDGVAVIKALRRIAPAARIVAVSGAADATTLAQNFATSPGVGFLLKPFNLDSLLHAVHEALGSAPVS